MPCRLVHLYPCGTRTASVGAIASRKRTSTYPQRCSGSFDELAEARRGGGVDPVAVSKIALRYSMEVLGPVPEGYV